MKLLKKQQNNYTSTKVIDLGSVAFRQPRANSHCRHVHGYKLYAKLWFGCNELDENNWVVDFGGLKQLKRKLQDKYDHSLCIDLNDPLLSHFKKLNENDGCRLVVMKKGTGIERITEDVFKISNDFIMAETINRCSVVKVEVWENVTNSAIYKED